MESKVADAATFGAICNPDGGPKPLKFQRKIGLQSFIINNGTAPISAVFEEEQTCKHDGWNRAGSEWYSHWIAGHKEVEAAGGQAGSPVTLSGPSSQIPGPL